jgi:hypothetical protein
MSTSNGNQLPGSLYHCGEEACRVGKALRWAE